MKLRVARPTALVDFREILMSKLPKFDIPGQVHFVTTNTYRRFPLFIVHDFCRLLLANFEHYRSAHKFSLLGYVIMPDHIHALILPNKDVSILRIMQDIKKYSAKQIREALELHPRNWNELGGLIISKKNLENICTSRVKQCLRKLCPPLLEDFLVTNPRTKSQKHQFWQTSFHDFNVYTNAKLLRKVELYAPKPSCLGFSR